MLTPTKSFPGRWILLVLKRRLQVGLQRPDGVAVVRLEKLGGFGLGEFQLVDLGEGEGISY
jgi:hypothetical protein